MLGRSVLESTPATALFAQILTFLSDETIGLERAVQRDVIRHRGNPGHALDH